MLHGVVNRQQGHVESALRALTYLGDSQKLRGLRRTLKGGIVRIRDHRTDRGQFAPIGEDGVETAVEACSESLLQGVIGKVSDGGEKGVVPARKRRATTRSQSTRYRTRHAERAPGDARGRPKKLDREVDCVGCFGNSETGGGERYARAHNVGCQIQNRRDFGLHRCRRRRLQSACLDLRRRVDERKRGAAVAGSHHVLHVGRAVDHELQDIRQINDFIVHLCANGIEIVLREARESSTGGNRIGPLETVRGQGAGEWQSGRVESMVVEEGVVPSRKVVVNVVDEVALRADDVVIVDELIADVVIGCILASCRIGSKGATRQRLCAAQFGPLYGLCRGHLLDGEVRCRRPIAAWLIERGLRGPVEAIEIGLQQTVDIAVLSLLRLQARRDDDVTTEGVVALCTTDVRIGAAQRAECGERFRGSTDSGERSGKGGGHQTEVEAREAGYITDANQEDQISHGFGYSMADNLRKIALQAGISCCRGRRIGSTGGIKLPATTEIRDSILKRGEWAGVPVYYGGCRWWHVEWCRKQRAPLKLQHPHAVAPGSGRRRVELGNRALFAVWISRDGADGYARKTGLGGIVRQYGIFDRLGGLKGVIAIRIFHQHAGCVGKRRSPGGGELPIADDVVLVGGTAGRATNADGHVAQRDVRQRDRVGRQRGAHAGINAIVNRAADTGGIEHPKTGARIGVVVAVGTDNDKVSAVQRGQIRLETSSVADTIRRILRRCGFFLKRLAIQHDHGVDA